MSARVNASGGGGYQTFVQINETGSTDSWRHLAGDGSAAFSQSQSGSSSGVRIAMSADSTNTTNTFGNCSIYIPNYAGSTNKSISTDGVSENNATAANQLIGAGLRPSTAAVTSLKIYPEAASFIAGSMFSLYKITKGSDGIVTTSP
jgi:hypothetical protein